MQFHMIRGSKLIKSILACATLLAPSFAAAADDSIPTGSLTIDSSLVRAGVNSTLGWSISYPSAVTSLITKNSNGTCTTKTKVRVQVRLLAAAFGDSTSYCNVIGYAVVNGSSTQIFSGTQNNVNTSTIVYNKVLSSGTTFDVKATTSCYTDGKGNLYLSQAAGLTKCTPTCATALGDYSFVALYNGEALPAHQASSYPNMQLNALDYIANYMNSDNTANIGDNQVIFLGDFNGFGSSGYDLNDFVLLVTFTAV
ncbi:MAG: hypothetical protein QM680_09400 [Luteolibacter sp.]